MTLVSSGGILTNQGLGNWQNIAESELSSLTRQCMATWQFDDLESLRSEISAMGTLV